MPGSPLSWRCSGTNQLLREGATVVRDAVDALDGISCTVDLVPAAHGAARAAPPGLPARLQDLLEAIERGEDGVDDHAATAAEARSILGDLTELELLGLIRRRPGGRYARVTR